MDPLLLILDLDETLVYATEERLPREPNLETEHYSVYFRPFVEEFLDWSIDRYKVAVWTSSSRLYAEEIVTALFPDTSKLEFVWSRDRCTRRYDRELFEYYWIKKFAKIKHRYDLARVLVVDDTPRKHEKNYGNLLTIRAYEGEEDDKELLYLRAYLETIEGHPNFRNLEKRGWRSSVIQSRSTVSFP